ncbi:hypothetical protein ACFYWX_44815 [Streptomyces sp. NPDC002888]|uniref:hypothetical protein n=1 Tax=Streptomyces sp. NPDC002888 TaxID=3364668 RepID=UPI00367B45B2
MDSDVQKTRTWAGLLAVFIGDAAISVAAIWGVTGTDDAQSVAILTSAFTAVSTMTTAYFGIRALSNTAQAKAAAHSKEPDAAKAPD